MDRIVISGGTALGGEVCVSGAKNASLPGLAATLLTTRRVTLERIPDVRDVRTMLRLLATLGMAASVTQTGSDGLTIELQAESETNCHAGYHLVRQMRASVCVLGPLVARRRVARVAVPGGCQIGIRPIDIHLRALAEMGADVRFESGDVVVTAQRLRGAEVDLTGPRGVTVTGTTNTVAAATLAEGQTVIRNAASEPEVMDFVRLLRGMGAVIRVSHETAKAGERECVIEVDGVDSLAGCTHRVIGDRIEAATWAAACAATRGQVRVCGFDPADAVAVRNWLSEVGVSVVSDATGWVIDASSDLVARDVTAMPHPMIPTDTQAQFAALLTQAAGQAVVVDRVFPDRFGYVPELVRLGANMESVASGVRVTGPARLVGTDVLASDLRASAALVIAGLAAEGTTTIRRVYHLDRGYERLCEKLDGLCAAVTREPDEFAF